jgi:hypothetical protein
MSDYWQDPTDTFIATDGYSYADANIVGSNLKVLHRGNGYLSTDTSLIDCTSSGDADIDMDNQAFSFNGANLYSIRYTDGIDSRAIGNIIYIKFIQATTVNNDSGTPPANFANIICGTNQNILINQTKGFMWDGTNWSAIV